MNGSEEVVVELALEGTPIMRSLNVYNPNITYIGRPKQAAKDRIVKGDFEGEGRGLVIILSS